MRPIRRILCVTEPRSDATLREAMQLARELGSMLTVLSVVPAGGCRRAAVPDLMAQIHDAEVPRGDCVPVHPVVRQGPAAEQVLAEAAETGADLVVLGAGETASRVIRRATCPVITVPPALAAAAA